MLARLRAGGHAIASRAHYLLQEDRHARTVLDPGSARPQPPSGRFTMEKNVAQAQAPLRIAGWHSRRDERVRGWERSGDLHAVVPGDLRGQSGDHHRARRRLHPDGCAARRRRWSKIAAGAGTARRRLTATPRYMTRRPVGRRHKNPALRHASRGRTLSSPSSTRSSVCNGERSGRRQRQAESGTSPPPTALAPTSVLAVSVRRVVALRISTLVSQFKPGTRRQR